MGFAAFGTYRLMLKLTQKHKNYGRQVACITVAVLVGLVVNTLLYLSAVNLYKIFLKEEYNGVFATIYLVLFTNIIPEYAVSLLLVPHIVLALRKATHLGTEGKLTPARPDNDKE